MNKTFFIIVTICFLLIQDIFAQQEKSTDAKTIKIGLLVSNSKTINAQNGAKMAIIDANKKGGISGHPLQLLTRSMEGPWGIGSKQAVNLIFNDNVWALIGSHDSRNAHLVEQVIAKTHVVFLSAWASDPTLSQAFVPWYFSCVPNSTQQATILFKYIYNKRKINNIAIISDKGYDSKLVLQNLLKSIKTADRPEPTLLYFDNHSDGNFNILLDTINKVGAKGIMLFGLSEMALKFITKLRQRNMNQPVFGPISLLEDAKFNHMKRAHFNDITLVSSENWLGQKGMSFRNKYQKIYGKIPDETAAYAYDAMSVIIEAIKISWPNRENLQNTMTKIHYKGVTGTFHFDNKGNRVGATGMIKLKNGIPVTVKK